MSAIDPNFKAILTNGDAIRGNATDARTGELIAHRDAFRVFVPKTQDTPRYMLPKTWFSTIDPADAYLVNGSAHPVKPWFSKYNYSYQAVIEAKGTDAIKAAVLGSNGKQPLWYCTEHGYCSPRYDSMKWHDRLDTFEGCKSGHLQVTIRDASGDLVDTVGVFFHQKNPLGQWVKPSQAGGKSELLLAVKAAIIRYEIEKGLRKR